MRDGFGVGAGVGVCDGAGVEGCGVGEPVGVVVGDADGGVVGKGVGAGVGSSVNDTTPEMAAAASNKVDPRLVACAWTADVRVPSEMTNASFPSMSCASSSGVEIVFDLTSCSAITRSSASTAEVSSSRRCGAVSASPSSARSRRSRFTPAHETPMIWCDDSPLIVPATAVLTASSSVAPKPSSQSKPENERTIVSA